MSISSIYPTLDDRQFGSKLIAHKNYQDLTIPPLPKITTPEEYEKISRQYCEGYEKFLYQFIAQQHLGPFSPYKGILLYHGLGFGKTCSAITFAEEWLNMYTGEKDKEVWIITSAALSDNFKLQLYRKDAKKNQCASDTYQRLWSQSTKKTVTNTIDKVIESRYKFFTYDKFGNFVRDQGDQLAKIATNRIIIVDEAHNLRNPTIRGAIGLEKFLIEGSNNRLVLLSATPMFDQPDEILQLLHYLVLNDKRTDIPTLTSLSFYNKDKLNKRVVDIFKLLCSNYISYVKGKNPFTLAVRLTPKELGFQILDSTIVPKNTYFDKEVEDASWIDQVDDGLLISQFTDTQQKAIDEGTFLKGVNKNKVLEKEKGVVIGEEASKTIPINTNLLEATNIVYPVGSSKTKQQAKFKIGFEGFSSILHEKKDKQGIVYDYYGEPYLYPSSQYLKSYSTKIYRILDLAQRSKGIVLIFSHYIWSGIMPIAIALEHLGYARYGQRNLLKNVEDSKYLETTDGALPHVNDKNYAIFCSDNTISGVDSFPALLETINSDTNKNGEKIKIILMSPVASEGISFKNVREVHILDPWYHFNRLEQVIGRSIRTCSHQMLPIEERNVTVYMHCSMNKLDSLKRSHETYDMYAYHLSADKKVKTAEIEKYIRDYALDCSLQKNVNYYPKETFTFQLRIKSSQNIEVFKTLGDSDSLQPMCKAEKTKKVRLSTLRKEKYAPYVVVAKERLRKILIDGLLRNVTHWEINSFMQLSGLSMDISILALKEMYETPIEYKNEQYMLRNHMMQVWLEKIQKPIEPIRVHVNSFKIDTPSSPSKVQKKKIEKELCDDTVQAIMNYDYSPHPEVAIVMFFTVLNPECWEEIAKFIVHENIQNNLTETLWKYGWLISSNEMGISSDGSKKWIGYIDIFLMKDPKDLEVRIWSGNTDIWRDATNKEIELLKKRRVLVEPPKEKEIYGFYVVMHTKKDPPHLKFKIMLDTESKREKTGIVATTVSSSILKNQLDKAYEMYVEKYKKEPPFKPNFEGKAGKENATNRTYLSTWLAYYLGFIGKLYTIPYYRPN